VKGGVPERIAGEVSGAAALSPDGRRIAFVRLNPSSWEASLTAAAILRRTQRRMVSGRPLHCLLRRRGGHYSDSRFHLVEVRLADGSRRVITKQTWTWPLSVSWSAKENVLIVTAATQGDDTYQLWMVRRNNGAITRLTNDLSNYDRVTFANNGTSLATVQTDTSAAIWVAAGSRSAHFVRVNATPLHSTHIAVAWTPGGQILYSDPTGDYRNLWRIDADGGNAKRLTMGPGNKDQIVATRDGRYIVYKQDANIWRIDEDGTHPRRLTHGSLDVHPDVSADGRSVVYASFAGWSPAIGGQPTLWRIPIDGGQPVEIFRQPASYPRESPDGRRLGCVYFSGKDPRVSTDQVAMLTLDGTERFTVFESSPSDETPPSWSPGGNALDYVVNARGVSNIWRQPSDGRPARPVTKFESDELFTFAWSRDGRLACVRGTTTSSVVLIKNFR
jgi:Tol biopolymer transport system component